MYFYKSEENYVCARNSRETLIIFQEFTPKLCHMKSLLKLCVFGAVVFAGVHFSQPATTTGQDSTTKTSAEAKDRKVIQTDMQALQAYFKTLGPKLQDMPAGIHNFQAPSSKIYRYEIIKSGRFYCPHQKDYIYRNIRLKMVN